MRRSNISTGSGIHNSNPYSFADAIDTSNSAATTTGLFSHPRAEALLSKLMHAAEKHEDQLSSLRCDFDTSHIQLSSHVKQIQHKVSSLEIQVESTHERLNAIEKAIRITATIGAPPSMTVAEGVEANRRSLARTLSLVSNKVDVEDLDERIQAERDRLEEMKKRELASTNAVQKINQAIGSLVSRVDVLADDIRNKIDKSLFNALSSEVACIQNYADFVNSTEVTVKSLKASLEEVNATISEHDELTQTLSDEHMKLQQVVKECPSTKDLEETQAKIRTVSDSISSMEESLEGRIGACQDGLSSLAKHLTSRLDNTYTKSSSDASIAKCVDKESFLDTMQDLKTKVDSKAQVEHLNLLHQSVAKLERELTLTKKKADLAAQFITLFNNNEEE